MEKIPMVVVAGPTATGKTELAVSLAEKYNGEIIGADSMQVYDRLCVGTARATKEEMRGIPHHLVGFLDPKESFSVAQYLPLAEQAAKKIAAKGKLPILCGGTGLYFSSLLDGIRYGETGENEELRLKLQTEYETLGGEALWQRLSLADPRAAEKIHPNNKQRLVRALELVESGSSITSQNAASRSKESIFSPVCIACDFEEREIYWNRVALRVEKMLASGLLEEAAWLFSYAPEGTAAQAIAYKECFPYLRGEDSLEHCKERLIFATRQYAKRQRTWLRRDGRFSFCFADRAENSQSFFENVCKMVESQIVL